MGRNGRDRWQLACGCWATGQPASSCRLLPGTLPCPLPAVAAAAQHGPAHRVGAPRQLAPSACAEAEGQLLGGISSFAFQGTNAHAILGKQLGPGAAGAFALPGASVAFQAAAAVQRTRYWVLPAAHPLVGSMRLGSSSSQAGAAGRSIAFECQLMEPRLALYSDHVVFARVLFPGAGMLEAALAAGYTAAQDGASGALAVCGMAISAPLVLPHPGQQQGGAIVMRCSLSPATGEFQLGHAERPGSKSSTQSAAGRYALAAATATAVAAHTAAAVAVRTLALRRALLGKALAALAGAAPAGHATGSIVAGSRLATDGYLVPPPCMDACLHLGVAAPGCGAKVPVAVGAFALADRRAAAAAGSGASKLSGATSTAHGVPAGSTDTASFALRTAAGRPLAGLADLETKVSKSKAAGKAAAAASVKPADYLYEVDWEAASHPAPASAARQALQPASAAVLAADGLPAQVDLAAGPAAAATAALALVQRVQAAQAAGVTAALPDVLPSGAPRPDAAGTAQLLAAGALEGLLRVAAIEHATTAYSLTAHDAVAAAMPAAREPKEQGILSTTRVRAGVAAQARLLPRCVCNSALHFAFRLGQCCHKLPSSFLLPRPWCSFLPLCIMVCSRAVAPAAELLQIRPMPRGSLASLVSQPLDVASAAARLRPHEVLVVVKAVGINFRCAGAGLPAVFRRRWVGDLECPPNFRAFPTPHRDVLNVLGMYPGDPGPPGSDCAGVVMRTGSAVTSFKPGNALHGALATVGSRCTTVLSFSLCHMALLQATQCLVWRTAAWAQRWSPRLPCWHPCLPHWVSRRLPQPQLCSSRVSHAAGRTSGWLLSPQGAS